MKQPTMLTIWVRRSLAVALLPTLLLLEIGIMADHMEAADPTPPVVKVLPTADFPVQGDGRHTAWNQAEWTALHKRPGGEHDYSARFKVLYSPQGIYFLLDGTDSKLTASMDEDFEDLWTEDVFEFFLWTDERYPIYFEYEISPRGKELPIIVPNFEGTFFGWRPWHYDGERKTKKAVRHRSSSGESGARLEGWTAEVFVPYDLLKPLQNVPPRAGTRWRANVYRVDYDDGKTTQWDWARVGPSFHEYKKFGTFVFE